MEIQLDCFIQGNKNRGAIAYELLTLFGHTGLAEWTIRVGHDWGRRDSLALNFWLFVEGELTKYHSLFPLQEIANEDRLIEYVQLAKATLSELIKDLPSSEASPVSGRWSRFGYSEYNYYSHDDIEICRPFAGQKSIPWEIPTPFNFILPIYFYEIVEERLDRKHLIPQSQTHLEQELIHRAKVIKETPSFKDFCKEQASLCGERWKKAVSDGADRYAEPNGILFPLGEFTPTFIGREIKEDVLKQIKEGKLPCYSTEHSRNSPRPYAKPTGDLHRVLKQNGREGICGYLRSEIRYSMATVETPNEWWSLDI